MASDRLMGKLIEIAYDDNRPAAVQLDAIKDSLNRAGLSKPAQVEVGPIKPFEEVLDGIGTGSRAESRRARGMKGDNQPTDLVGGQSDWELGSSNHDQHTTASSLWERSGMVLSQMCGLALHAGARYRPHAAVSGLLHAPAQLAAHVCAAVY